MRKDYTKQMYARVAANEMVVQLIIREAASAGIIDPNRFGRILRETLLGLSTTVPPRPPMRGGRLLREVAAWIEILDVITAEHDNSKQPGDPDV